jgi:septum site-determining protein MinC
MNNLTSSIQIKGLRDGLLVSLSDAPWDEQSAALLTQIDGQPAFFQGARLALDVGPQMLKVNEMVELRDRLSERNVSLWAVISTSDITEKTAQLLGLATRVSKPRPEEVSEADTRTINNETALFINKTIRSGTRIEFPGNVVVLGDVNPGAEIVADGNVIIWGRLRGSVHAGSAGDENTLVCALDFLPMRLQIADVVFTVRNRKQTGRAEIASVHNQKIIVGTWQTGNIG